LWHDDPYYDVKRGPVTRVVESKKGGPLQEHEVLTLEVRRNIDAEYMKRAKASMKAARDAGKPFFVYFNHSMMHMPTVPRQQFKGKTGYGDFADSLLELDTDFGELLDYLKELGVEDNTIVVFSDDPRYGWVSGHIFGILDEFEASVSREPLIPAGAPLDHVPNSKK
jgi:arylsulfatase